MKDKSSFIQFIYDMLSPLLLILGDLALFFKETMFVGYILFSIGCILGIITIARLNIFNESERFHLLVSLVGLATLGVFAFTGATEYIVIAILILFVIDFMILAIDNRNGSVDLNKLDKKSKKENYSKYNEEKIIDELNNIKEELNHVQVFEDGDIDDLTLKSQVEKIREEFSDAVIVQDPKEGRYFYKENGKSFHTKDCTILQRANKKDLKSSNSRTQLLAKGYSTCKICNS